MGFNEEKNDSCCDIDIYIYNYIYTSILGSWDTTSRKNGDRTSLVGLEYLDLAFPDLENHIYHLVIIGCASYLVILSKHIQYFGEYLLTYI